jgi:hypothetical protein
MDFLKHAETAKLIDPGQSAELYHSAGALIAEAIEFGRQQERDRASAMLGTPIETGLRRVDMLEFGEVN